MHEIWVTYIAIILGSNCEMIPLEKQVLARRLFYTIRSLAFKPGSLVVVKIGDGFFWPMWLSEFYTFAKAI